MRDAEIVSPTSRVGAPTLDLTVSMGHLSRRWRVGSVGTVGAALAASHLAQEPCLARSGDGCVLLVRAAGIVGRLLVSHSPIMVAQGTAGSKFVIWVRGHLDPQGLYGGEDFLDIGRDQWVVGDPGIAHDAVPIQDEDRPTAHAPESRERLLRRVGDPERPDHLAIEIAQQRERQVEGRGERGVGTVTLDTQAKQARAESGETVVVLTERTQLQRSNAAEVEQVPGQHRWPSPQHLAQSHGLARAR